MPPASLGKLQPHWVNLGSGRAGTQFHGFLSAMKATISKQDPLKCLVVCLPDEFKKSSKIVGLNFKTLAYASAYFHSQWCHCMG